MAAEARLGMNSRQTPSSIKIDMTTVRPAIAARIYRRIDDCIWRSYLSLTQSPLQNSDLRRGEWLLLRSILSSPKVTRYLEVGVYHLGCFLSAGKMLRNKQGSEMLGVDLFDLANTMPSITLKNQTHVGDTLTYETAKASLHEFPFARLERSDSSNAMRHLLAKDCKFDLIFIDGNHAFEAALSDSLAALELLSESGYLALHNTSNQFYPDVDYISKDGGPRKAALLLSQRKDLRFLAERERMMLFQSDK